MVKKVNLRRFVAAFLVAVMFVFMFSGMDIFAGTTATTVTKNLSSENGADKKDDTAAIQELLDCANETTKTVYVKIPAGTYYISSALVIYSNTILELDDGATIVRMSSFYPSTRAMIAAKDDDSSSEFIGGENITITGGTWDNNYDEDGDLVNAVFYFVESSNITLSDFTVKDAKTKHMIILDGVSTASITNVTFLDQHDPVSYDASTSEALHTDISENKVPCSDITVTGCTFKDVQCGVGSHNMNADDFSTNLIVTGCTFENVAYSCINVYKQKNAYVYSNTAENVGGFLRISCSEGGSFDSNIINGVTGSYMTSSPNFYGAILVYQSTIGKIYDNEMSSVTGYGICLYSSTCTGDISYNEVSSVTGFGICLYSSSTCTGGISYNEIDSVSNHGIVLYGSTSGKIYKNEIQDAGRCGISVCDGSVSGNINGNEIIGSASSAIYVGSVGKSISIYSNTITGCTHATNIYIDSTGTTYRIYIYGNQIQGNSKKNYGVYVNGAKVSIYSNVVKKCKVVAYIDSGSTGSIHSNILSDNTYKYYIYGRGYITNASASF